MKKSKKVAFAGSLSALSLLSMFFTGIIPFFDYTLPALSGILLIPVVIEIDKRTAFLSFLSVGFLSALIVPNKEAAILFIAFLGYYPILKSYFESFKSRFIEWTIKIIIFNISLVSSYFIAIYIFNLSAIFDSFSVAIWILYPIINFVFIIYDIAISRLIDYYFKSLRNKIIKKLK